MKRYYLIVFLSVVLIWTGLSSKVSAVDLGGNFSVSAVIPENQINLSATYFDIEMTPGDIQTLEVVLENHSDEEVTVLQSVNTAITNSNGVVDYSRRNPERDSTLTYSFGEMAAADDEITLSPKSSQTVSIEIELPNEPFEGVLLGGIHYQEKKDEENKDGDGVQIQNNYAFVLGIQISVGNVDNIQPELQLNDILPTQRNYRNVVTANIQNAQPIGIKDLSVETKIYKEGSNSVLHEEQKEHMAMAPNSNFDFPISWENQRFEDGTYVLEMTAVADGETWSWRETFVIGNSEELNEEAILDESDLNYMKIGILALAGGGGVVWLLKRRQEKGESRSGE